MRIPNQQSLFDGRHLVWFSCGAASACAAKLVVKKYPDAEVLYCDTLKYEHPDNIRFMADVERWIGKEIKVLKSDRYDDIFDVFKKTGWLVGVNGARCTLELKRNVREQYQRPGDIHCFGMGADEPKRIERFEQNNPELYLEWVLVEADMDKQDCLNMLMRSGIELPQMYHLGYKNNNCIGCVKGGMGYWNKIRVDFPDYFARMARFERELGATVFNGMYLDELSENRGRYETEYEIECGPVCSQIQLGVSA